MFTSNAVGTVLTQADTFGHIRRYRYDIAGQLIAGWLTLKGQREQVVTQSIDYNAAGLIVHEVAGNGVVTTYDYEPETQRLIGIKTARPTGHSSGAAILQDLRYSFDPVGNVICIRNDAEATRFWRNQKIVPEQTFIYDSLYQLASATGREMANLSQQINMLPSPSPIDDNTYTQYTRSYVYDRDGNLCRIRHSAPTSGNQYTRDITVSSGSNRAILSSFTDNPDEVEKLFDRAGRQLQLLPGQTLNWNGRGELQQVTPVMRNTGSDREFYRYDAGGQRVLKETRWLTGNTQHVSRKVYLAGVERMQTYQDNMLRESYQRIQVQNVQVLHWEEGLPVGLNNDSVRYNHWDLIGNNLLETDKDGLLISREEMYPFGETAIWAARSQVEAFYKVYRYSGKERDATGLYYYGFRYYQPWLGRWLSADPAGPVDGLNQYWMVRNNPLRFRDNDGLESTAPLPGDYRYKTNFLTSFKLRVAKQKAKILVFDSEKNSYVPSNDFKLVRLNSQKGKRYQFTREVFSRKLDEFFTGYQSASEAASGVQNPAMQENLRLGVNISRGLRFYDELNTINREHSETKVFPGFFQRIFNKESLPEEVKRFEYFALINKADKQSDGDREIYALGLATVTNYPRKNRTVLSYEYLVANPRTQINPDIYAHPNQDGVENSSRYAIKGVGGYSTVYSIAKLFKKYNPDTIRFYAANVRSAAIGQKFGAIRVEPDNFVPNHDFSYA